MQALRRTLKRKVVHLFQPGSASRTVTQGNSAMQAASGSVAFLFFDNLSLNSDCLAMGFISW